MSLATQVKVPAQVKGAVGGGGGTFTPGGTSDQFLDGTGAPKSLSATDIPAAIPPEKEAWSGWIGSISAATVTISAATPTNLSWSVDIVADAGKHSTSTNPERMIADATGWYEVDIHVTFQDAATTSDVRLFINGNSNFSYKTTVYPSAGVTTTARLHVYVFLTSGQYVVAKVNTVAVSNVYGSGGALDGNFNNSTRAIFRRVAA